MSGCIPFGDLSTETLVRMFADYSRAVDYSDARDFEFQIERDVLISELERMYAWLQENQKANLVNGNGHR